MKKLLLIFALLVVGVMAWASSKDNIVYPVAELGGCKDEQACRIYCNDRKNITSCLNFAVKHNLMSEQEIKRAKAMMGKTGPGGCQFEACETYCQNSSHMLECMDFAISNPEILASFPEQEREEMLKIQAALKAGAKLPAGCTGKEACEALCNNPPNDDVADQCFDFALKAGFMPPEMTQNSNMMKMARIIMREGGPGGCRREECEEMFMDDPEAAMAWMKAHGINPLDMMPPEAKQQMEQGMMQLEKMLATAPAEVKQCVEETLGGSVADVKAGKIMINPSVQGDLQGCFMDYYSEMMDNDEGPPGMMGGLPPGMSLPAGPGGCQGSEECMEYCSDPDNAEECKSFTGKGLGEMKKMMPQGIPEQCATSADPMAIRQCMMNYCMQSFMSGGQPDPACVNAMQQGVSSLVNNSHLTAQFNTGFDRLINRILGR